MIAPAKSAKSAASLAGNTPPACIVPDCTRPAKLRGVCASCYQNASKLIQRGNTTWAELERLEIVRPPHSGPKGHRAALYVALEAARAKAKEARKPAKSYGKKGK